MIDHINISNSSPVNNIHNDIKKDSNSGEPKDQITINTARPKFKLEPLSKEVLEKTRKDMEEKNFVFNEKGCAPAIIYSIGDTKLIAAEELVTATSGEYLDALWLVDAFTANITPEAYYHLSKQQEFYTIVPNNKQNVVPEPRSVLLSCIDLSEYIK